MSPKGQNFERKSDAKLEFQKDEGRVLKLPMGGAWIFSGTAHSTGAFTCRFL